MFLRAYGNYGVYCRAKNVLAHIISHLLPIKSSFFSEVDSLVRLSDVDRIRCLFGAKFGSNGSRKYRRFPVIPNRPEINRTTGYV